MLEREKHRERTLAICRARDHYGYIRFFWGDKPLLTCVVKFTDIAVGQYRRAGEALTHDQTRLAGEYHAYSDIYIWGFP